MKILLGSLAITLMTLMTTASAENNNQFPTKLEAQLKIEDLPGTFFDGKILPDSNVPLNTDFPFQILQPQQSKNKITSMQVSRAATLATPTPAERSGCPELNLDSAVYTNFTAQGQIQCYSIELTEATKIEGLLTNIPSEVNYSLYLFKLEDDNNFTVLDYSTAASVTAQQVVNKVEPGIYILAAESTEGVAIEQAIMGWFNHPDFDGQEANDKLSQATPLSSTMTIQGNIDSQNDLDFFSYQTDVDQSQVKFTFSASEQFILELWTGSAWVQATNNKLFGIDVNPDSAVIFRARGDQNNLPPVSAQYAFTVSNADAGTKVSETYEWNNENLTNLLNPSKLEAHNKLGMSGKVIDDAGTAIPYANVFLRVTANGQTIGSEDVLTDTQGKFSTTVALPDCTGTNTARNVRNRTYHGTPTNPELWWDISYERARYYYFLTNSSGEVVYSFDYDFEHICKEKIVRSCHYQRDYQNGGEEYICR